MEVELKNLHLYKFVLDNVPRMLSWIDRRKGSPTYGSSDRNYWHYKIVDFSCSMLQETALTLALLYTTKFNGNYFYGKNYIKNLALAQVLYWKKIQNRNGSFDEFFPNEQSFSATAFTLYSSCKTLQILNEDHEFIRENAKKSCEFLINYGDPGASNQISASIAAINLYSILFNDTSFDQKLNKQLNKLLDSQSDEGWTPEYGSFDVGYQSITLAYLSDYNKTRNDKKVSDAIKRMIEYLSYFIHPNGSVGGEYGSRSTTFFSPYGFSANINNCKSAFPIYKQLFLNDFSIINNSIDDRYICHFILPSYLLSIKNSTPKNIAEYALPYKREFNKLFKETGLYIHSTPDYYFITNLKKGGVFNLYSKNNQKNYVDAGYVIEHKNKLYVTNWLNAASMHSVYKKENKIKVTSRFYAVSNKVSTPFYHTMLRIISFIGGKKILPLLKRYFIHRQKITNEKINRSFILGDRQVEIIDEIQTEKMNVKNITFANPANTFRYVAPSNYFQDYELIDFSDNQIKVSKVNNKILFRKVIDTTNFDYKPD